MKYYLTLESQFNRYVSPTHAFYNDYERTVIPTWVNPTLKEIKEGGYDGSVRFIGVKSSKKVYIWPGMEAIHEEIINSLKIPAGGSNYANIICGEYFIPDKVSLNSSYIYLDDQNKDVIDTFLKEDWSWLEEYFPPFNKGFVKLKKDLLKKSKNRK